MNLQDSHLAWLPLFYALPKELVRKRKDYLELPRNPYEVLYTDNYNHLINNNVFLQLIWESYAWSVWQFIQVPCRDGYANIPGKWTDYSGNFPLWRLCFVIQNYFRQKFENEMEWSFQKLFTMPSNIQIPWLTYQQFSNLIGNLTDMIVEEQNRQPMIDEVLKNRQMEDYSERKSTYKRDFINKWYCSWGKKKSPIFLDEVIKSGKEISEELLDNTVAEIISKLVNNPKFAAMMQQKITMKVDTSAIQQEISNHEKQLRQSYSVKSKLIEEIDTVDPDDKHYIKRKADLDDRLYKMYDKIEDTESLLIAARAKKTAIEAEKLTADNIYKVLIYFDKLYAVMDEFERRKFMESLVSEVHVYEECKPNGQWLKSIKLRLPIIEEDMEICLDNGTHVETVCLLSKL